ncbi:MAG: glycoside hydrolase family 27 protein [Clostridia bacterium]|nr:glycoside hydrolase family 27 protein [Clostridia bacterium]
MSNHRALAKTPPMGWNSWDCFGATLTEQQLRENADYMAAHLKDYGWEYVVCDIQWYEPSAKGNRYHDFAPLSMDEYGRLTPAENRFPSAKNGKGFKPIADYCHSLGLKFGIHIMRGIPRQAVHADLPIKNSAFTARQAAHHFSVCSWNTDMYGMYDCEAAQDYYDSIFELYASWDVDFIKCDDICVTEFRRWDNPYSADYEVEMIRKAMDRCGRDMVLSLSPGPALVSKADHLAKNANMWRITGDFWDDWKLLLNMFERCHQWESHVKTGAYPDCDMLPLGRIAKHDPDYGGKGRMTRFTPDEQQTLMSLWGIFRSPLIMGGNLPENDDRTLALLTNKAYLQMHRDSRDARQLLRTDKTVIWTANGNKCKYAALFNISDKPSKVKLDFSAILMPGTRYTVTDIWNQTVQAAPKSAFTAALAPHACALLKIE